MDTQGNAAARSEVAAIKVVAMEVAHNVVNRAVQTFGAAGVSEDTVLARLFAITRALQIADGPNEVHLRTIGNLELAGYRTHDRASTAGSPWSPAPPAGSATRSRSASPRRAPPSWSPAARPTSCEAAAEAITKATGVAAVPLALHVGQLGQHRARHRPGLRRPRPPRHPGQQRRHRAALADAWSRVSEGLFDKTIEVNLKGPFRLMAVAGARMAAAGGGSIVNISSIGAVRPSPPEAMYAASKNGLNALTMAFAQEYAPHVRVNCVMPGAFATDMADGWDEEFVGKVVDRLPAGRLGTARRGGRHGRAPGRRRLGLHDRSGHPRRRRPDGGLLMESRGSFDLDRRKVAIVTGASSGLGEGFARTLVGAGATVVAGARRLDRLEVLAKELDGTAPGEGSLVPVGCDVTSEEDRPRLVEWPPRITGRIDVLVNNAGMPGVPDAEDETVAGFAALLDLNLAAGFHLAAAGRGHGARGRVALDRQRLLGDRPGLHRAHRRRELRRLQGRDHRPDP